MSTENIIEEFQSAVKVVMLTNQLRKALGRVVELVRENERLRAKVEELSKHHVTLSDYEILCLMGEASK